MTLLAALDVHRGVAVRIPRYEQMDVSTEVAAEKTLRALEPLGKQLGS